MLHLPTNLSDALWRPLLLCSLCWGLSACDTNDDDRSVAPVSDSVVEPPSLAGRLLVSEAQSSKVAVIDLQNGQALSRFQLPYVVTALYSSPGFRYGLVLQRNDNLVSFIDGGLYQEDHGDHLHAYQQDPLWLNYSWDQVRPTHYETHDAWSALFFDGLAEPYAPASIALLSDQSITEQRRAASLELPRNMHGTAEPRGDYLLTTYRPEQATTTSPTQVELYRRNGDSYRFIQRFETTCPGLHGSFSSHDFSVFGCTDGVLVVEQDQNQFSAYKIANPASLVAPARIGTLLGDKEQDKFIGVAGDRLFAIDPVAKSINEIDWRLGQAKTRLAHGYSPDGQYLLLDNQGRLHRWDALQAYKPLPSLDLGIELVTGNPPVMVFHPAQPIAYVSDPALKQIHQLDLESAKTRILKLDFTPSKLAWTGLLNAESHAH